MPCNEVVMPPGAAINVIGGLSGGNRGCVVMVGNMNPRDNDCLVDVAATQANQLPVAVVWVQDLAPIMAALAAAVGNNKLRGDELMICIRASDSQLDRVIRNPLNVTALAVVEFVLAAAT